jgi:hypothetical protein
MCGVLHKKLVLAKHGGQAKGILKIICGKVAVILGR